MTNTKACQYCIGNRYNVMEKICAHCGKTYTYVYEGNSQEVQKLQARILELEKLVKELTNERT